MQIGLDIPPNVGVILKKLKNHGHKACIVGGAVRDMIMGRSPHDFDVMSSASVSEVLKLFDKVLPIGEEHGTAVVFLDGDKVEVTLCKTGYEPGDDWQARLREDLLHRDFTINAMAVDEEGRLADPYDGLQDIKKCIIRAPEDRNEERIHEDPLRMLRAVRLAAVLDFQLDEKLSSSIIQCLPMLTSVSVERIREELVAILVSERPGQGIRMLVDTGLMKYIIPELLDTVGFNQHNPYHIYNVFDHTLAVIEKVPAFLEIRLAALFHDIAKPATFTLDEKGIGHFYQHQRIGGNMTKIILSRMKFSGDIIEKVSTLVGEHMSWLEKPTPEAVKRLINRVGAENLPDLFTLQRADLCGSAPPYDFSFIDQTQEMANEILTRKEALTVKDLAVNGQDLMDMGYLPGEKLGKALNRLLDIVLSEPEINRKDRLMGLAAEWLMKEH